MQFTPLLRKTSGIKLSRPLLKARVANARLIADL
jgi:hypothetical protein